MSNCVFIKVLCDKCEASFTGHSGMNIRAVRARAKADHWKLGKQKDFCPDCAKQIAAAVKEAALGNI